MSGASDNPSSFDPAIQSENIACSPADMVACDACKRANPPRRLTCLYCGHDLQVTGIIAVGAPVSLRKLEIWERGWNVILRRVPPDASSNLAGIVATVGREAAIIQDILALATPMPIARVGTEREAYLVSDQLTGLGLESLVLADETLDAEHPPKRLRSIIFDEFGIAVTSFNTGHVTQIPGDDLAILVQGILVSAKTNSLEKRGIRGNTTILDESDSSYDEAVLDIYTRSDPQGFRIYLAGFDFSCLGEEKRILASDNLGILTDKLKAHAVDCRVVDHYKRTRHLLDGVWNVESRNDPSGLIRAGFGKLGFGKVASTNNGLQFTKFSRFQWHLQ